MSKANSYLLKLWPSPRRLCLMHAGLENYGLNRSKDN